MNFVIFFAAFALGQSPATTDVDVVARQGVGTAEGRAAWDRLARGGPEVVVLLLRHMNGKDTVAANWLRTALDRVLADTPADKLPLDEMLAFVRDPKNAGRARRLALEVVEAQRPGTARKLYVGW